LTNLKACGAKDAAPSSNIGERISPAATAAVKLPALSKAS